MQIATCHLNETLHGQYVIWIASCPSGKRTAISSPLFSILFSQISFTSLNAFEYMKIIIVELQRGETIPRVTTCT